MTNADYEVYQPPQDHEHHIRAMIKWLAIFFGSLFILLGAFVYFADRLVVHLPFSVEKNFVRPYEEIAGRFFSKPATAQELQIQNYLQDLSEQLAADMALPADFTLQVHYLKSDTVNAFATLGGHIFVFRGLLEAMPDENSLAMVLAHEIAHIQHRDPIVSLGRGAALQMLYGFVSGDYSSSSEWLGLGGDMGLLYFSREQELAADKAALKALYQRYGHVAGYRDFFELALSMEQQAQAQDSDLEWLQTHPATAGRITLLQQYVAEQQWEEQSRRMLPTAIASLLQPSASK